MKTLKVFLITVSVLMVIALSFVGYVWYQLQVPSRDDGTDTEGALLDIQESEENAESIEEGNNTTPALDSIAPIIESEPKTETVAPTPAPTLSDTTLTEGQEEVLEKFGIDASSIQITDALIECAEDALGKERYNEIIGGAAPGPLESLKLLGCTKQ